MKHWLLFTFIVLISSGYSQNQTIYVHDLENGTLDSILSFPFDTTLSAANTGYFEGEYSLNIAPLSDVFPTLNTFPQSEFALKRKVSLDYSIDDFPLRAAVKTFGVSGGVLNGRCSGAMVSRRHVLTSAHCHFGIGTNDLSLDTFMVYPAYDNGSPHPEFDGVNVSKIYVMKNWGMPQEDFAILELSESIGYQTGWLGVGFEEDTSVIFDRMHYKFSYPATYLPAIDSNVYNGDTMYYNYGKLNYGNEFSLGVGGGSGIPGESGSPLIHIENDQEYTVYGTFTFLNNLLHMRIRNRTYHAIFSIIEDDLNVKEPGEDQYGHLYPNPATHSITIEGFHLMKVQKIQNSIGQEISNWRQNGAQINIDQLTPGIYFLFVETESGNVSLRFVKQ